MDSLDDSVQTIRDRAVGLLVLGLAVVTYHNSCNFSFATQALRPGFANSPSVHAGLAQRLIPPHRVASVGETVEAPAPVDMGNLRPTGILPDGTELWEPAENSPLAGRVRVRIRNGQVIGQEVFR